MSNKLKVSDYATLRWLERGVGFDVDMLKRSVSQMLDGAFQAAEKLGVDNYLILLGGDVYLVRDGTLVTVVPDDGRRHHLLDPRHKKEGTST